MFKRRKPDELPGNEPAPPPAGAPGTSEALLDGGAGTMRQAARPDSGVGVPPFRPAPKEAPMGRTPYPAPNPAAPPPPTQPGSPAAAPGMAAQQPRPGVPPGRAREPAERRMLVVGRGISVQGTVQDAERLVVQGTVEATMIHATELSIAEGGVFKGAVEVEEAEIAGLIDGTLTARGNLIVRATGKVMGTAHYRRLQVEDGGQISGELKMIVEPATRAEPPRPATDTVTG